MLIVMILGLLFTIGGYIMSGLTAFIILLFIWLFVFLIIKLFAFQVRWMMALVVIGIAASVITIYVMQPDISTQPIETNPDSLQTGNIEDNDSTETSETSTNKAGEILVEAETGTLSDEGPYSYIGKSARGEEAYLGDGGATADYVFKVEEGGEYELWVKLSDDAMHDSGTRDATIVLNGTTYAYQHESENTKGWKWYKIGNVALIKGNNSASFTKVRTTSAAYVMDAFKFVPTS